MTTDPTLGLPSDATVAERNAEQERRREAHNERLERIVQAFTKLPVSSGEHDLAAEIAAAFEYPARGVVELTFEEIEAISLRIAELNQMVMQGAMVLDEDAIRREAAAMQRAEQEARAAAEQPQRPQGPEDHVRTDEARERIQAARAAAKPSEDRL